ncbi:hypothetical protein BG004_000431 [Podila humilis]|nr:hypothetical protein BG004_000431 [Podila humilis]
MAHDDSMSEDGGSRRGSMSMDHVATITPTPSPQHPRSNYPADSYSSSSTNGTIGHLNGHSSSLSSSQHHLQQQQQQQQQPHHNHHHPHQDRHGYPSEHHHHAHHSQHHPQHQQPTPTTPSPPLPSPTDGFQGRPLPPIEPSHPLHSYMSNSRRGSLADPEYHATAGDAHRRPSDASPGSYYQEQHHAQQQQQQQQHSPLPPPPPPAAQQTHRQYATSSPVSTTSSSSEYPPQHYHTHPTTSPMQLRQSEHASGRRESLPSIHSSAGPLGQLLAQEPQRRHSIAHSDPVGPLKRKTSSTPLSQVHSSSTLDYPAKRRDSIPDAAIVSSLHPHYPPRSSYSAPSSPPRRGSIVASPGHGGGGGGVPVLNLQPPAEIKSSMVHSSPNTSSSVNGHPGGMDHGRPHFPLHQPRRPSLLSESSMSRRSSLDPYHSSHYHPYQQPLQPHQPPTQQQQQQQSSGPTSSLSSSSQSQQQQGQDYDHNMRMDMEKMHINNNNSNGNSNNNGPEVAATGGGGGPGSSHLHPGYHAGYSTAADGNGPKGDTPYSRSPELRVSHKLAERKRRKEMKELFDELRDSLPVDRSLKTSKWEILSKAVDYIEHMKDTQDELVKEIDMLRLEVERLKQQ